MAISQFIPDRRSGRDKVIIPIALVAYPEGETTLIPASTLDSSSGGLRIQAFVRFSIGEVIRVQFDKDPTDLRQYKVVWTKAGNAQRPGQAGLRSLESPCKNMPVPMSLPSIEPELDAA